MIISGRQAATTDQSGMAGMLSRSVYVARIHTMQKALCTGLVLKYGVCVTEGDRLMCILGTFQKHEGLFYKIVELNWISLLFLPFLCTFPYHHESEIGLKFLAMY